MSNDNYMEFKTQATATILRYNPNTPADVILRRVHTYWSLMSQDEREKFKVLSNDNMDMLYVDFDPRMLSGNCQRILQNLEDFKSKINFIKTHELAFNKFCISFYEEIMKDPKNIKFEFDQEKCKNIAYCIWQIHSNPHEQYINKTISKEENEILGRTEEESGKKSRKFNENCYNFIKNYLSRSFQGKSDSTIRFLTDSVYCLLSEEERMKDKPELKTLLKLKDVPISFSRYKYVFMTNKKGCISEWRIHRNKTSFDKKMEIYCALRSESQEMIAEFINFASSIDCLKRYSVDTLTHFFLVGTDIVESFYEMKLD